nr:hypothetical protein [Tanacetum cinerariifolium]
NVEDKILVSKPLKNCARCTRCGYLVDGPNCQVCALLRQELEENLVTHSPDFQNTSEPSNASTNVVNAPREPYVVKQDNGSFIFDLNRAPTSPNQFHCFHCKDVLRDGEACKRSAKAQNWKFPVCYDDDDDEEEEGFNSLQDNIISELPPCSAITPNEPVDSLIREDEHFNTILATKSDEFIKSYVENLVPIPSESEDESECDVPDCDDSQTIKFFQRFPILSSTILPLVMTSQVMMRIFTK